VLQLNCLARGLSKIEHSSEWVWGLTFGEPAGRGTNDLKKYPETLMKIVEDFKATRFQFNLPPESAEKFFKLRADENSACEFLLNYGVLREQDLHPQRNFPKQIQRFWSEALRKELKPFALPLADIWNEQAQFKAFINIGGLLSAGVRDNLERTAKIKRADELAIRLLFGIPNPEGVAGRGLWSKMALWGLFSDKLDNPAVRLDFREGAVLPSIYTLYALPGLYAHVWKHFLDQKPWKPCAKCGRLFVVTRPGKIHCSVGCKNAAKQQRYRERHTEPEQSKRRRGGKR
jgi:hypothetical protein